MRWRVDQAHVRTPRPAQVDGPEYYTIVSSQETTCLLFGMAAALFFMGLRSMTGPVHPDGYTLAVGLLGAGTARMTSWYDPATWY